MILGGVGVLMGGADGGGGHEAWQSALHRLAQRGQPAFPSPTGHTYHCKGPDMMAGLSMRSHSMHNIQYVCIIQCIIVTMKSSKN